MADVEKINGYDIADATARAGLLNKQDTLTAGNNINIDENNVISATGGTTYLAGNNIVISGNLPSGYTQLEYVDSDGTGYIDTGHALTANSVVTLLAKGTTSQSQIKIVAGSATTLFDDFYGFTTVTNSKILGINIGNSGGAEATVSANDFDIFVINVAEKKGYINGVNRVIGTVNPDTTHNVYLLAANVNGTATRNARVRVKEYKQEDNGVLVCHYLPCINSSDQLGFYDLVSGTFKPCSGLTAGPLANSATISAVVPSVNNATITVNQGGVQKGQFTLNQSSNSTINLSDGQIIQVETMPTAGESEVGRIVQFIGVTDTYTNGYFYKCVATYTDATEIVRAGSAQLVASANITTFRTNVLAGKLEFNTPYLYEMQGGRWWRTGSTLEGTLAGLVITGPANGGDQVNLEVDAVYAWERVDVQPQSSLTWGNITGTLSNQTDLNTALSGKQETLVSGTNIKTINNNSLLGSGDITIDSLPSQSGQSGKFLTTDGTDASWATVSQMTATYNATTKTITFA